MIKKIGVFKDFSDGSIKTVFENEEKRIIEMTLLFNKENVDVVCVPTHHFCNLGCKMCHLTNKGLNKAMIPIKVSDFFDALVQTICDNHKVKRTDKRNLKISFMGVGEPLLNLALIEDVYKMEDRIKEYGYDNVGYAISTMMPNKNILKLKDMVNELDIPLKVHFSLHTPVDENRFELLPNTKVYVKEALEFLCDYRTCVQNNNKIMNKYMKIRNSGEPIEIHYTLIKGVNDGNRELELMCELLSKYRVPIKFIRFNAKEEMVRSDFEKHWVNMITKCIPSLGIKVYSPPGKEIGSSCGEFTKHYYHEEIETENDLKDFNEWKLKHLIEQDL